MQYKSTRDSDLRYSASQVISQGISTEGGLFVPETLPDLSPEFPLLQELDYRGLAKKIFSYFLTDFTPEEIEGCVDGAYASGKFDGEEPVKLVPLTAGGENKYLLELWHGPTCAFKDLALQILPRFLTESLKKAAPGKETVILTATSGDTGKAALEGFRDVPGTRIIVFYPRDGVSPMQKRQMVTQEGGNVAVCAVEGNFDDAQTAVKRIFVDDSIKTALGERGLMFSSANSINWGRLLPQIVYYFWSYFQLVRSGAVAGNAPINIAVPTGNFGNILAACYAGRMGLPIKKLICASNANKVLTDFIRTGVYDRRRDFYATTSPSMDILISSNLERLLYALAEEDSRVVAGWMNELSAKGCYDVGPEIKAALDRSFFGGFCDDKETAATIRTVFQQENYLCDTHTAVGVNVYRQYVRQTGDTHTPTVIASTANPYKFAKSVLSALGAQAPEDEFSAVAALEQASHTKAPKQLWDLQNKEPRFSDIVPKQDAAAYVRRAVGIGGT